MFLRMLKFPVEGLETRAGALHNLSGKSCPWQDKQKKAKSMAADRQNLQDAFLNHVRKTKVPVTIFLINGVKLQGVITWFDNFCVLLRRDGQSQLVYKHAISTIMPAQPINLYDGED
ncbi:host factor-I protein [Rhodovulum imhoffii]|uniref:RNA-binding protein Hfq n=2 Tax=Rhodovulum imhoffii TaxID=365340 RepID=A0A2T5BTB8_9RHOB|nr:host factor-I protein [Rhodovulum imhoffii]